MLHLRTEAAWDILGFGEERKEPGISLGLGRRGEETVGRSRKNHRASSKWLPEL
jgi:hypothetical protein